MMSFSRTAERQTVIRAPGWIRSRQISDVEDLETLFDPKPECMQLGPGPFFGQLVRMNIGAVSVCSCEFSRGVQIRQRIGENTIVFAYLDRGDDVLEHGRTWKRGSLLVVNDRDLDLNSLGHTRMAWVHLNVSMLAEEERERLLRKARRKNVLVSPDTATNELHGYAVAAIRMSTADPKMLEDPQMGGEIESELMQRVRRVLAESAGRGADVKSESKSFGLVQRVERFMWDNLEEPITLERICASTNCRMRSLIYSFKDRFGLGPITYLKIRRLNAVHRRLKETRGNLRIFDVAADFGFWHMGHFGTDYKRMFGKTPSETVSAARVAPRATG